AQIGSANATKPCIIGVDAWRVGFPTTSLVHCSSVQVQSLFLDEEENMKHPSFWTSRRSRREFLRDVATLGAVTLTANLMSACQPAAAPQAGAPGAAPEAAAGAAAPGELPRNETLYVAGLQWGPFITFNPLAPQITWPNGETFLVYEALFAYNVATGEIDPLLAKS